MSKHKHTSQPVKQQREQRVSSKADACVRKGSCGTRDAVPKQVSKCLAVNAQNHSLLRGTGEQRRFEEERVSQIWLCPEHWAREVPCLLVVVVVVVVAAQGRDPKQRWFARMAAVACVRVVIGVWRLSWGGGGDGEEVQACVQLCTRVW